MTLLSTIGTPVLAFLNYLGELTALAKEVAVSAMRGKHRWQQYMRQVAEIGYRSQPVVIVTGAFTGSVLAAQALFQLTQMKMETLGGALVAVGMLRELGPTITGLMLAGRVGAAMAAEIGTMKVTEQVDALRSMGVHPIDYLVTPRFGAMAISIPLLIAESSAFGILAATFVGTQIFDVSIAHWIHHMNGHTALVDVLVAMVKGLVFGQLIVLISCHQGLKASNGAVGVGKGTTSAMVLSSLAILIFNFFLTMLLNIMFPLGFAK
ncbi:intermembrane phospholipid transport system permease protein MlaE [Rubritalea halochordaticola]|uniref:Intermembrane phospholipid transport system permease protein MlaE n=1 Tax=Rubritalea halochordaticola TaxID=714537 RepID=A0ABP9V0B9_9BACT